jgi:hypothetical protein
MQKQLCRQAKVGVVTFHRDDRSIAGRLVRARADGCLHLSTLVHQILSIITERAGLMRPISIGYFVKMDHFDRFLRRSSQMCCALWANQTLL